MEEITTEERAQIAQYGVFDSMIGGCSISFDVLRWSIAIVFPSTFYFIREEHAMVMFLTDIEACRIPEPNGIMEEMEILQHGDRDHPKSPLRTP